MSNHLWSGGDDHRPGRHRGTAMALRRRTMIRSQLRPSRRASLLAESGSGLHCCSRRRDCVCVAAMSRAMARRDCLWHIQLRHCVERASGNRGGDGIPHAGPSRATRLFNSRGLGTGEGHARHQPRGNGPDRRVDRAAWNHAGSIPWLAEQGAFPRHGDGLCHGAPFALVALQQEMFRSFRRIGLAYAPSLLLRPILVILGGACVLVFGHHLDSSMALALTAAATVFVIGLQAWRFRRALGPIVLSARPVYERRFWIKAASPAAARVGLHRHHRAN